MTDAEREYLISYLIGYLLGRRTGSHWISPKECCNPESLLRTSCALPGVSEEELAAASQ